MAAAKSEYGRNIPLFVAFRVLFNARFYYPILGVLFIDLGLTLEQYSLLNVIWAVAILTLEVPSGALADVIGRKRMVVIAAGLMVLEMLLFAFAPTGNPTLLFWMLAANRFLSGAAEASASGADEALAYDSLDVEGREKKWPAVLESLIRWQSGAFFFVMIVGATIYDAAFLTKAARFVGVSWNPADTVRWPVFATLGTAVLCLACALALKEPGGRKTGGSAKQALTNILRGARCVAGDRRILLVLLAALVCDSFVRLFMTFESNYLRLIDIPAAWYGVIGAAMAPLGFAAAPLARMLVEKRGAAVNFLILGGGIIVGLVWAVMATNYFGILAVIPLGLAMSMLQFFTSYYLNAWSESGLRATVLSFRGVALNIAYGTIGILFAGLTARMRTQHVGATENVIFANSLTWLPWSFAVCAGLVVLFALSSSKRRGLTGGA